MPQYLQGRNNNGLPFWIPTDKILTVSQEKQNSIIVALLDGDNVEIKGPIKTVSEIVLEAEPIEEESETEKPEE